MRRYTACAERDADFVILLRTSAACTAPFANWMVHKRWPDRVLDAAWSSMPLGAASAAAQDKQRPACIALLAARPRLRSRTALARGGAGLIHHWGPSSGVAGFQGGVAAAHGAGGLVSACVDEGGCRQHSLAVRGCLCGGHGRDVEEERALVHHRLREAARHPSAHSRKAPVTADLRSKVMHCVRGVAARREICALGTATNGRGRLPVFGARSSTTAPSSTTPSQAVRHAAAAARHAHLLHCGSSSPS